MAKIAEIGGLGAVESRLKRIIRNEKVKDPHDRESLRIYANKMVLVSTYMLEFNELNACIEKIPEINRDNVETTISERRFTSETKRDDAHILFNRYFLKLAKLQNDSSYLIFIRSVPE